MKKLLKERLQELAGIARKKYRDKKLKPFRSLNEQDYWPTEIDPDLMNVMPLIFWHPDGGTPNTAISGPCATGGVYAGSDINDNSLYMYPIGLNNATEATWGIADWMLANNVPLDTPFSSIYWDAPVNTLGSGIYGAGDDQDPDYISPCLNPDISEIYEVMGSGQYGYGYGGFSGYEYRLSGFNMSLPTYSVIDGQIVPDTGTAGFDLGTINSLFDILDKICDFCQYTMTESNEFPEINTYQDCADLGMSTPYVLASTYGLGFGSTWNDWYTFLGTSVSYNCPATQLSYLQSGTMGSCGRDYCQCECNDPSGCIPPGPTGCDDPDATNYFCTLPGQSQCDANTSTSPWTWTLPPNFTPCETCCSYSPDGCTNPEADNYNPNATIDDGTCSWTILCHKCQYPTELYDYGTPGILVSTNFSSPIDPTTVEDPCSEGWSVIEPDCSGKDKDKEDEREEFKRYACKVTTMVSPTESNYECVEDPNGPFLSLTQCENSGCGDVEEIKYKKCYKCKGFAPVGNQFPDPPGCPKGWQDEILTIDDCKTTCDDPLVDQWLSNYTVQSMHCCDSNYNLQAFGSVDIQHPDCQNTWMQLGGDPNFNPHQCCPPAGTAGQPGLPNTAIPDNVLQRLKELAGIKKQK